MYNSGLAETITSNAIVTSLLFQLVAPHPGRQISTQKLYDWSPTTIWITLCCRGKNNCYVVVFRNFSLLLSALIFDGTQMTE